MEHIQPENMMLINCSENCKYCCDGHCTLNSAAAVTNYSDSGCIYKLSR